MLIELSDKQVARLQALKQEMLTQDTCCQAAPRYWGIMEEKAVYHVDSSHADDSCLMNGDEIIAANIDEIQAYIEAIDPDSVPRMGITVLTVEVHKDARGNKYLDVHTEYDDESYDDNRIADGEDAAEYLNGIFRHDFYKEFAPCFIEYRRELVRGPVFLTKKAAEVHIAKYGHNYSNPNPYAMTALRSPEIEFLWKLIEETEWSIPVHHHEITREMVEEAYDAGLLHIEKSPVDDCIAAYIGEHWFYFGGYSACEMSSERYAKQVPTQYILDYVHKALEELRNDNETEYDYYFFFLKEHGVGKE